MWLEIIADYSLFLLKVATFVGAGLVIFAVASKYKKESSEEGAIELSHLSQRLINQQQKMSEFISFEDENDNDKEKKKDKKKKDKKKDKAKNDDQASKQLPRLFVIDYDGDIHAHEVAALREEITAISMLAQKGDEVLLRLESPGGVVNGYGLAASQLQRLRDQEIPLTVAVDKVAASGGYMMACVANKIIAAPFSVVGSIGVVAEIPNFHRLLKKHDIDVDVMTAGEYKRTVTVLGENTAEGKEHFQQELQKTHQLFKEFVTANRPQLDIDAVANGATWYGTQAIELNLVDEISTSDDYILGVLNEKDVYQVKYKEKKNLVQKIGIQLETSVEKLWVKLWNYKAKIK